MSYLVVRRKNDIGVRIAPTLATAAGVLTAIASYLPVRRAARIEPLAAIREE